MSARIKGSATPIKVATDPAPDAGEPKASTPAAKEETPIQGRVSGATVSKLRAKLPLLLGAKKAPPEPSNPVLVAQRDLAQGIQTKNVEVPPMQAQVVLQNGDALKEYGTRRERVVLQKLADVAFGALNDAHNEIKPAIEAFDKAVDGLSPGDLAASNATFAQVCKGVTQAQEGKVNDAVAQEWAMQQKRNKALAKLNVKFATTLTLNSASLATQITATALSMGGALPMALLSIGKTAAVTAFLIKNFAAGRESAAQDVAKLDKTLSELFDTAASKMAARGQATARELIVAAGIPFVASARKMDATVDEFLAKSARVDKEAQKLFQQAGKLVANLENVNIASLPAGKLEKIRQVQEKADQLLSNVGDLMASIDDDNKFYAARKARAQSYLQGNPPGLNYALDKYRSSNEVDKVVSLVEDVSRLLQALV